MGYRHQGFISLIGIVVFSWVLSACLPTIPAADLETAGAVETELARTYEALLGTDTPSPTILGSPPPTVTPTNMLGSSPTPLSTPSFESSGLADNLLFGSRSPDCDLPCWQGLTPGESTSSDIEIFFNTTLGFNGAYDLMSNTEPSDNVPGLMIAVRPWIFRQDGANAWLLSISTWINDDTQLLEGVTFSITDTRFRPYLVPQQVLRELGMPSHMMAGFQSTESATISVLDLLIVYEQGVTFYYPDILIRRVPTTQANIYSGEFCLDQLVNELNSSIDLFNADVYLTKPFSTGLDQLSPFQEYSVGSLIEFFNLQPFEEVFGVSLEEVTQMAIDQDNACVYADWD